MILNKNTTNFLEDILHNKITDIETIAGSYSDQNKIHLLHTKEEKYVLKTFPDVQDVGEEDLFDVIYDCGIHELVQKIINSSEVSRKIFHISASSQNSLNVKFAILKFVDGISGYSADNKQDTLAKIWLEMLLIYNNSKTVKEATLLPIDLLPYSKESDEYMYLLACYDTKRYITYTNKFFHFFINDVQHFAPLDVKTNLLNFIEIKQQQYRSSSYCLIHSDLKLTNTLVTVKREINIIDWSRGHFGDPLIDLADIIINLYIYTNEDVKDFAIKQYVLLQKFCANETDYWFKLSVYIKYKLFSISRVFVPDRLNSICTSIVSIEDPFSVLLQHSWLKGVKF